MVSKKKFSLILLAGLIFCSIVLVAIIGSLRTIYYPTANRVGGCGMTEIDRGYDSFDLTYSDCYRVVGELDDVLEWYQERGWLYINRDAVYNYSQAFGPFCLTYEKIMVINDQRGTLLDLRHSHQLSAGMCG